MAETQPPTIVEGATTGDVEDEIPKAKSAEDRKAAAALSSLDTREDESVARKDVDQEAVKKAMDRLAGINGPANGTKKKEEEKKEVKKVLKVDQADVAILVEELELSKVKATELLRAHDGNVVNAMRAFVNPAFA